MQDEAKRKTLICPGCGARILRVTECVDLSVECFNCGASVLATVMKSGNMAIDFKPGAEAAVYVKSRTVRG